MQTNKISATIILYNPTEEIFKNIDSYINYVYKLIVVDNSPIVNINTEQKLSQKYDNIIYVANGKNLGIATALNIACDKAIELKQEWILTMDQDSYFQDYKSFLECFHAVLKQEPNIAIITPNHTHVQSATVPNCNYESKQIVITSGNMLRLQYFNKIGRYNDELFIDMVDYDLSLKVELHNLKTFMLINHYIIHNIGEIFKRKNILTGKIKEKIEHNPQRVYYMTRNRLIMSRIYSKKFPKEFNLLKSINILFIHDVTKILLYEGEKRKKIYAKVVAFFHFLFHKSGEYKL